MEHPEDNRLFRPYEPSLRNLKDNLDGSEEDYTYNRRQKVLERP